MDEPDFTERQREIINLLTQGKSNKEIALALGKSERTVEDHLNHIYAMLGVSSRAEAIIKLLPLNKSHADEIIQAGKSTVAESNNHAVESTVANKGGVLYDSKEETLKPKRTSFAKFIVIVLLGILVIVIWLFQSQKPWTYEREAEFPDEFTVGQNLDRSNASDKKVHGQFGSQSFDPWLPQAGFTKYYNIEIPKNGMLYLQICYSKFSKSSVPILIYLDDEQDPRESIYPIDPGDWNKFIWTEWITLGETTKGTHSIKFFTNGQEFGVADLDKFILTTEPPE